MEARGKERARREGGRKRHRACCSCNLDAQVVYRGACIFHCLVSPRCGAARRIRRRVHIHDVPVDVCIDEKIASVPTYRGRLPSAMFYPFLSLSPPISCSPHFFCVSPFFFSPFLFFPTIQSFFCVALGTLMLLSLFFLLAFSSQTIWSDGFFQRHDATIRGRSNYLIKESRIELRSYSK